MRKDWKDWDCLAKKKRGGGALKMGFINRKGCCKQEQRNPILHIMWWIQPEIMQLNCTRKGFVQASGKKKFYWKGLWTDCRGRLWSLQYWRSAMKIYIKNDKEMADFVLDNRDGLDDLLRSLLTLLFCD